MVLTASSLCTLFLIPENFKANFTEIIWSDESVIDGYPKSKLMAEKAAWEFQKTIPEAERFDLVTILPGMIQGPSIIPTEGFSTSNVKMLMTGMYPALPNVRLPIVDVRDVVFAHV